MTSEWVGMQRSTGSVPRLARISMLMPSNSVSGPGEPYSMSAVITWSIGTMVCHHNSFAGREMRKVLNRASSTREASDPKRLGNAGQRVLRAARRSANRPHISATPRDQTDTQQVVFLKSKDIPNETDTQQQLASSI